MSLQEIIKGRSKCKTCGLFKMKILVVHPGKQHSYRTAKALFDSGKLCKYITSVYNGEGTLTNILYKFSKGTMKKKIGSHNVLGLPEEKIEVRCEWLGILSLIILKISCLRKFYERFNQFLNDIFAQEIVRIALQEEVDAVISYDNNSCKLFETLKQKAPKIKCILDVSIVTRPFMREVFLNDYCITSEESLLNEYPDIMNTNGHRRIYKEIRLADYFLVPSEIVQKSLIYCGADQAKIRMVPYGTDCSKFEYCSKELPKKPLKLIFVGAINHRKGLHHLLKIVASMNEDEVDLTLVGEYNSHGSLYKEYSSINNIHFCGFVAHDHLVKIYQESDVFVLPSLGEGMAMVIIEAMSCGLPVIM